MILLMGAGSKGFADAPADQNSEALEMIAQRMRSLSNSLEKMPRPPAFDQKIQLPDIPLAVPQKNNSEPLSEKEKR